MMDGGMADPGFPGGGQIPTRTQTSIRFDPSYVRTIPGVLKIVQMFLNMIGYICVMVSANANHSRANWFGFVSMTGFWVTGILLVFYLMHLIERLSKIPWLMAEFGYTAIWTFFYFTAALACATWGGSYPAWAAAAFFGFCSMIVYGADAFFKFKGWRGGDVAQGERVYEMEGEECPPPGAY